MVLNGIILVVSDLDDSVDFYTRVLGLKEIARESDEVCLQGREIGGNLILCPQEAVDMDEGSIIMSFSVDNLDSIVQELKRWDIESELKNNDDGTQEATFPGPNDEFIHLTTAPPPAMAGGEESEICINGFALKTHDVEDSVNFFTQVLGAKEIEGWAYEDNPENVGLQAGDIVIELSSTGWFETKGFSFLRFAVNNLNHSVQKLEAAGVDVSVDDGNDICGDNPVVIFHAAGVDVSVDDVNEQGWRWVFFDDPDDVRIGLCGPEQVPDEGTDIRSDENAERPSIGEKVRFWEEQDKINQALIPRVMEMHDIVTDLHKRTANINSQIAATEARVLQKTREEVQGLVNEAEASILQKTREYVQNLVNEAEARVLKQVNDQLPNLVQRQVSQALKGVRRIAYTAVILAALALVLILYFAVT